MQWSNVSKIVGWDEREVQYPTMMEVEYLEKAMQKSDTDAIIKLLTFHRFLKSPVGEDQTKVIEKITSLVLMGRELLDKGLY